MNIGETISGAVFLDDDRKFRVALWRIWNRDSKPLLFVGLNPSTASEFQDDPTIRRVARFARDNGYGGLFVGNLFDQVTPNPDCLDMERDQSMNDVALHNMREMSGATLVGWGHFGDLARNRVGEVLQLLREPLYCLGKTKDGWPRHPLYIAAAKPFERYVRGTK